MTNKYSEFATKLADRDILLLKNVIDLSYSEIPHGTEPELHDILVNFNTLSSEQFDLSDSDNAFLYAVILKMSEITRFELPKVMSFLSVSQGQQSAQHSGISWAMRLELVYQHVYYHHLYVCFRNENRLSTAFHFMRLEYHNEVAYRRMTYEDGDKLIRNKWELPDGMASANVTSSTSSSPSSSDGHSAPHSQDISMLSEASDFTDKVEKMKAYLESISRDGQNIDLVIKEIDEAANDSRRQMDSNTLPPGPHRSVSQNSISAIITENSVENASDKIKAPDVSGSTLSRSIRPLIQQSRLLYKDQKESFLAFMDNLLHGSEGVLSNSINASFAQEDEKDEMQDNLIQDIKAKHNGQERPSSKMLSDLSSVQREELCSDVMNKVLANNSTHESLRNVKDTRPPSKDEDELLCRSIGNIQKVSSVLSQRMAPPNCPPQNTFHNRSQEIVNDVDNLINHKMIIQENRSMKTKSHDSEITKESSFQTENRLAIRHGSISQISNIDKPDLTIMEPEEVELDRELKLEVLQEHLEEIGKQLYNENMFIGFILWRELSGRIVEFKLKFLKRKVVVIISEVFDMARCCSVERRINIEKGNKIVYRLKKQRCLKTFEAFREFYAYQRPHSIFRQQDNFIVRYFAENYMLELKKLYYKLLVQELNAKMSVDETRCNELVAKYNSQSKNYKYVRADSALLSEIKALKEKLISNQKMIAEVKFEQSNVIVKYEKLTTLTVQQFNHYKSFKMCIELFDSTRYMPVQMSDAKMSEIYLDLEGFLNKNLMILGREYVRRENSSAGHAFSLSLAGKSLSEQQTRELFGDTSKTRQLLELEDLETVPMNALELAVFELVNRYMKQHMSEGHQMIPSSESSLRRPVDYLNFIIFSYKYQNYYKQIFVSVLRFYRDVNQCKVNLLIEKKYLKKMRRAAILRNRIHTVEGYVDEIYNERLLAKCAEAILDEYYERSFISDFVQRKQINLIKTALSAMKEALKAAQMEEPGYVREVDNYYFSQLIRKTLIEMVSKTDNMIVGQGAAETLCRTVRQRWLLGGIVREARLRRVVGLVNQRLLLWAYTVLFRKYARLSGLESTQNAHHVQRKSTFISRCAYIAMRGEISKLAMEFGAVNSAREYNLCKSTARYMMARASTLQTTQRKIQAVMMLFNVQRLLATMRRCARDGCAVKKIVYLQRTHILQKIFHKWENTALVLRRRRNAVFERLHSLHNFLVMRRHYRELTVIYKIFLRVERLNRNKLLNILNHWRRQCRDKREYTHYRPVLENFRELMGNGMMIKGENGVYTLAKVEKLRYLLNRNVLCRMDEGSVFQNGSAPRDMNVRDLQDTGIYVKREVLFRLVAYTGRMRGLREFFSRIGDIYNQKLLLKYYHDIITQHSAAIITRMGNMRRIRVAFKGLLQKAGALERQYSAAKCIGKRITMSPLLAAFIIAAEGQREVVRSVQASLTHLYACRIMEHAREKYSALEKMYNKVSSLVVQEIKFSVIRAMRWRKSRNCKLYVLVGAFASIIDHEYKFKYFNTLRELFRNIKQRRFGRAMAKRIAFGCMWNKFNLLVDANISTNHNKQLTVFMVIVGKVQRMNTARKHICTEFSAQNSRNVLQNIFFNWTMCHRLLTLERRLANGYSHSVLRRALRAIRRETSMCAECRGMQAMKSEKKLQVLFKCWRLGTKLYSMGRIFFTSYLLEVGLTHLSLKYRHVCALSERIANIYNASLEATAIRALKDKLRSLLLLEKNEMEASNARNTQWAYAAYHRRATVCGKIGAFITRKTEKASAGHTYHRFTTVYHKLHGLLQERSHSNNIRIAKMGYCKIRDKHRCINSAAAAANNVLLGRSYQWFVGTCKNRIEEMAAKVTIIEELATRTRLSYVLSAMAMKESVLRECEGRAAECSADILYGYCAENILVLVCLNRIHARLFRLHYFRRWEEFYRKQKFKRIEYQNNRKGQQFMYMMGHRCMKRCYMQFKVEFNKIREMQDVAREFIRTKFIRLWYKELLDIEAQEGKMSRWELMQRSIRSSGYGD